VEHARGIVRDALGEQNLPGLSVAVGVGGEVVWAEGFGWADVKHRLPVTPDTRFKIGTTSTVLTSAAVGVLLEQGRLNLDEPVHTYVPQFPAARPVTLRQLMGHYGGVGADDGQEGSLIGQRCERPVEALPRIAGAAQVVEPGSEYRSSTYGWIAVSAAVEGAGGQPFLRFMREQVFLPLGMRDTGAESAAEENPEGVGEPGEDAPPLTLLRHLVLEPLGVLEPEPVRGNQATFYSRGWGPKPLFRHGMHHMRVHNLSCYAGSMAFFSTPSDLVRFGLAMNNGTLLQPSTVQLLRTSQRLAPGLETSYGLGWDLDTVTLAGERTPAAGQDGELLGRTVMSFRTFPEAGLVVAVMSNTSDAETSALAARVAEAFK
jgi:CubicO group peptidase (beta-lactamase class C family)